MIFDTHAHYNDLKFNELDGGKDALLNKLFSENVGAVVNASVSFEDSQNNLMLAENHKNVFACVGIHPEECGSVSDIPSAVLQIRSLTEHDKVVAIGEIGLDYHYEGFDRGKQKELFFSQLKLAGELKLPVVIHDRDAHGDTDDILSEFKNVKAVLHSYSGSAEWAKKLVRDGRYISFSGVVTFKNAKKTVEAAEVVPLERILVETDCPYLAPHPLRGTLNHSANISYVIERLAETKSVTPEKLERITFENACRFYNIDIQTMKKIKQI